jgi:hypothetical protein
LPGGSLPAFVVQLILLRHCGYTPMLWFRVCYYLLWRVLRGQARLESLL